MTDTSVPLEVTGIFKSYGSHQVLKNVSLSLRAGELFGLIGLNGVGKTTLIKIMLDLTKADKGDARLFGEDCRKAHSRRNICYLPEKFQPSRYLRGREYLALSLSYFGRKFSLEKAREEAVLLDLDPDQLENKVGGYSKGMGQKLGLIGAFLIGAPFLILDEPMSGLDPRARILLKNRLLAARAEGKTIFFSSHILSDIDEICNRIGVISDASLVFLGTPSEFKTANPADSLEKSFLRAIA